MNHVSEFLLHLIFKKVIACPLYGIGTYGLSGHFKDPEISVKTETFDVG